MGPVSEEPYVGVVEGPEEVSRERNSQWYGRSETPGITVGWETGDLVQLVE